MFVCQHLGTLYTLIFKGGSGFWGFDSYFICSKNKWGGGGDQLKHQVRFHSPSNCANCNEQHQRMCLFMRRVLNFFGSCADTLRLTVMKELVLNETQAAVCWAELCLTLQLSSTCRLAEFVASCYSISLDVKIHVGHLHV